MPQLSWWHNHVLPAAAGCTQSATSTTLQPRHRPEPSWSPAGRGAEEEGGETGETLWWERWVPGGQQQRRAGTQSSPDYSPLQ